MGLSVNTNIAAMNSYRNLSTTNTQMAKSLEKLSSGFRINRAADDAAGLAISEGLRSQIGGLKVAVRNTQDGISVVQTAEGALTETHSILQRMRDLAVQAGSDSNDVNSRAAAKSETDALASELNRIASSTKFNGNPLLDGTYTGKSFQVGSGGAADTADRISVSINSTGSSAAYTTWKNGGASATAATATFAVGSITRTTAALTASTDANNIATQLNSDSSFNDAFMASVDSKGGLVIKAIDATQTGSITVSGAGIATAAGTATSTAQGAGTGGFSASSLNVSGLLLDTAANATASIDKIDAAIKMVSTSRANLGALQNRFEHTINNLNVTAENLTASESRIRDTDMAQEMTNFTRTQILTQAGTAMLAQANQSSQGILKLLG
ncbi:MAG: fliC [Modestobacter sp.]|jgi:flagellin|nr:fliC [Modestobacter sp.]MCW2617612.1 fliC [Modestobacter sp.]